MKFYLISENVDTAVGMRLAGIEGVVVHEDSEVKTALDSAIADPEIAVVLITERLMSLCPETIYELKLNAPRPLIVEIPDRHGVREQDSIMRYVREAIGVKI